MIKILFVCLGNICRSPLAEAQFNHVAALRGLLEKFEVDSCGTSGYHVGHNPDARTIKIAETNKVRISHKGRQLKVEDFYRFNYLVVMDSDNYRNVLEIKPDNTVCEILYLRRFDKNANGNNTVPDPYYGTSRDFENMYDQINYSVNGFLDFLIDKHHVTLT